MTGIKSEQVTRSDPRPPELAMVWYDTPEAVHESLWLDEANEQGVTVKELLAGSEAGGLDQNGCEISFSNEEMLAGMRAMGCWGWVDTEENVIHAWVDAEVDPGMVAHFLAHEIGHVTGTPDPDPFLEEMRAEQFGFVTSQALRLMQEVAARQRTTEPSNAVCQLPAGLDLGFIECCLGDYLSRIESGEVKFGCDNLEYLRQQVALVAGRGHESRPSSWPKRPSR